MNVADMFTAAVHGIAMDLDPATMTFALSASMRAEADRQTADGSLACLVEARELHAKHDPQSLTRAHRLLYLVHLRALELKSAAMVRAAANVCLEAGGHAPIQPSGGAS